MKSRLPPLFASVAFGCLCAFPAAADQFDLPPMIGGVGSPPAAEPVAEAVAEPGLEAADVPQIPPDAGIASAPGDIPLPDIGLGDMADGGGDASRGEDLPGMAAPRDYTLQLEMRAARNELLDGSSIGVYRGSAHWFGRWSLGEDGSLIYNLRARATKIEGASFTLDDSLRLDLQELAYTHRFSNDFTLEFGRLNIRNGVAQGFNPTDWFKADSLITADSQDPSDRREERLGTLIIGGTGSVGSTLYQFGFRPRIRAGEGSLLADKDVIGMGFDRTNPSEAAFLKVSPELGGGVAMTGYLLWEDGHAGAGFEVSSSLGDSLVFYGETFIQDSRSIAAQALRDGQGSAAFRRRMDADDGYEWLTQAAIGMSWSLPIGQEDASLSLEYHFNDAGLSDSEIDALAAAEGMDLAAAGAIRNLAAVEQMPLAREQLFARFAWNDIWGDADFTALGFYVPHDESGLIQVSAGIPLFNDNAEISLRAITTFGGSDSIYGANPVETTTQVALTYTF